METPEELIRRRRAGLTRFAAESRPVLVSFAADLGATAPEEIATEPLRFVTFINDWCSHQDTSDAEDRIWLTTRIGYFLGELAIRHFGGEWGVCSHPGHETLGQYVVISSSGDHVDVFQVAHSFVVSPPPRILKRTIDGLGCG